MFQDVVEEGLAGLQARLSNLEETMGYLPRDSIESMLSSLVVSQVTTADGNVESACWQM